MIIANLILFKLLRKQCEIINSFCKRLISFKNTSWWCIFHRLQVKYGNKWTSVTVANDRIKLKEILILLYMCSGYWLEYNVNIQKSCIHIMYIGYYIALVGGHRKRTLCQVWVGFFLIGIFMYFLEQLKIILLKL